MTVRIGTVTPFEFETYLVLALDGAWAKVFDKVTFDVAIVNNRLQITSSQTIQK